jgi:sugar phosphate isomerase/epimerase
MQNRTTTVDVVKRACDEYNKFGENALKAGITQFLHDESFEMGTVDGRLVYQALFELLDPRYVKFQFQMSAMTTVGDPVMYFTKYPGRFISMHLQGVNLNPPPAVPPAPVPATNPAAPGAPGQAGRGRGGRGGPQLAVGKDSLDWAKIFTAAKTGGIKNYFVEQSWDLTVQSVAYLKTLNV